MNIIKLINNKRKGIDMKEDIIEVGSRIDFINTESEPRIHLRKGSKENTGDASGGFMNLSLVEAKDLILNLQKHIRWAEKKQEEFKEV